MTIRAADYYMYHSIYHRDVWGELSEREKEVGAGVLIGIGLWAAFFLVMTGAVSLQSSAEGREVMPLAILSWITTGSSFSFIFGGAYLRSRRAFGAASSQKQAEQLAITVACFLLWLGAVVLVFSSQPTWLRPDGLWAHTYSLVNLAGLALALTALAAHHLWRKRDVIGSNGV